MTARRIRSTRIEREKKSRSQKNHQPAGKGAQQTQTPHPAQLFPNGQIDRVTDARFTPVARHHALNVLGQTVGNRSLQRMVSDPRSASLATSQQHVVQRGILDWIKKKIGSDPEGAVRSMDTNLGRASKILELAATSPSGSPELRQKLARVKDGVDNLKSTTSGVVKVLDARDKVRKVWAFASAIESIPDDVAADPEKAAQAFGKVFSTAGELGEMLPAGPWTPYFRFLQNFGDFFSNMLYGLDPKKKPSNRRFREFLP